MARTLARISGGIERFCGVRWPTDYCAFDLETSGFNRGADRIVEWGHCIVRDGEVVDRNNVVLNWFDPSVHWEVSEHVRSKLLHVARQMDLNDRPWRIDEYVLRNEGIPPAEALSLIWDFLETVREQGLMIVAHNGWNFDVEMLRAAFSRDLVKPFDVPENGLLDTGALVKATQIPGNVNVYPRHGDTLRSYCRRAMYAHGPGVKWNLDTHCMKKYGLAGKYPIKEDYLHTAGEDAYILTFLMAEFRRMIDSAPPEPPPAPASPSGLICANKIDYRGQRQR